MKKIILSLLLFISFFNIQAAKDSLQVSLITISPGEMVYEKFGHTALRVKDFYNRFDIVFNYGLFSFNAPNFLYRFVKGETDYQLGVGETNYFLSEYAIRGSEVIEQVIELDSLEAQKLFDLLLENNKEENRVYRYNFFFDNCSTRPRDILIKSINGTIAYDEHDNDLTFRDLIYEKTGGENTWLSFGIDMLMGSKTDRVPTYEQRMFLPDYLMKSFDNAQIVKNDSSSIKLIQKNEIIFEKETTEQEDSLILSPYFISSLLLIIFGLIFYYELKRGKIFRIADSLVFLIFGLIGVVVYFLNFFSLHPCVDKNYNCFWLQPLNIFAGILIWVKSCKKVLYYYHFANFVLLFIFLILCSFISQHLNLAFYPLIMIIMSRSLIHIILGKRDIKK